MRVIKSVTFVADGSMAVEFVNKTDVKSNGMQLDQVLFIPGDDQYDDEIDAVRDAVIYALNDALEDLNELPVFEPRRRVADDEDDEDDEDEGDGEDEGD